MFIIPCGEVRQPSPLPRVANRCIAHGTFSLDDPSGNVAAAGRRSRLVGVLEHHPCAVLRTELRLEGFVEPHVNGLDKPSAARGDEHDLAAKCLNRTGHAADHVNLEAVKENNGNDVRGG